MHLSTSTVCNYLNATPSGKYYVAGEAVLRLNIYSLLCGIPNLKTIHCVQTSGIKSSSTKCFQQTRICLVILFPIFNFIFHIFFLSDVGCIPTQLIKIFNPFMVIVNSGLFLYSEFFYQ
jgi:hypothetical protein